MDLNGINAIGSDKSSSGSRQIDIYKRIQKFRDEFANAASLAATGKGAMGPSIFTDTRTTGAHNL